MNAGMDGSPCYWNNSICEEFSVDYSLRKKCRTFRSEISDDRFKSICIKLWNMRSNVISHGWDDCTLNINLSIHLNPYAAKNWAWQLCHDKILFFFWINDTTYTYAFVRTLKHPAKFPQFFITCKLVCNIYSS